MRRRCFQELIIRYLRREKGGTWRRSKRRPLLKSMIHILVIPEFKFEKGDDILNYGISFASNRQKVLLKELDEIGVGK